MQITFATYNKLPDLDQDDRLVMEELHRRGIDCRIAVWDDPAVTWNNPNDVCIIRSTWEYYLRPSAFLTWATQVARHARLFNSLKVIERNWHKEYLIDFSAAALPVIPTVLIPAGAEVNVGNVLEAYGWMQAVVKPAVSAGTFGVKKVSRDSESLSSAQSHTDRLLAGGDVLVQKYLHAVTTSGERSLVFFNGEYSHALRKVPFHKMEEYGGHIGTEQPVQPEPDELAVAHQVLAFVPQYIGSAYSDEVDKPLYARVDLARDEDGSPMLMELELIEPSLFFSLAPGSEKRFADALLARVGDFKLEPIK